MFWNLFPHQLPGLLQFVTAVKYILGYQEKRPAVKIQVEKSRRLNHIAELPPCPDLVGFLGFNGEMVLVEIDKKRILERSGFPVDHPWQPDPECRHHGYP